MDKHIIGIQCTEKPKGCVAMLRTGNRPKHRFHFEFKWSQQLFLKILLVLVLLGMIYGVVIVGSVSQQTLSKLAFITDEFLDQRLVQSVLITFWHSFIGSACLLLLAFVCGFCAIAQPIPIGILLFRGFGA